MAAALKGDKPSGCCPICSLVIYHQSDTIFVPFILRKVQHVTHIKTRLFIWTSACIYTQSHPHTHSWLSVLFPCSSAGWISTGAETCDLCLLHLLWTSMYRNTVDMDPPQQMNRSLHLLNDFTHARMHTHTHIFNLNNNQKGNTKYIS